MIDLELDIQDQPSIEARYSMRGGSHIVVLRVKFVVRIGVDAAECVFALIIRNARFDRIGAYLLKVDDRRRNRILIAVHDNALDGPPRSSLVLIRGAAKAQDSNEN